MRDVPALKGQEKLARQRLGLSYLEGERLRAVGLVPGSRSKKLALRRMTTTEIASEHQVVAFQQGIWHLRLRICSSTPEEDLPSAFSGNLVLKH
jgi:hypothetical protein